MLSQGMTLVEVMISVIIFAILASSILAVIAAANKMSNKSRMRDKELAGQANIVSKKSADDMLLIGDTDKGYTIRFSPERNTNTSTANVDVGNIYVWRSNKGSFGEEFGFQVKTLAGKDITGLNVDPENLQDDEYMFSFTNNYYENVTIEINIKDGLIFEGVRGADGYRHPSQTYIRTVEPGRSINFGYYKQNYNNSNDLTIDLTTASYNTDSVVVNPGSIDPDKRTISIAFEQAGSTDPSLVVDGPKYD